MGTQLTSRRGDTRVVSAVLQETDAARLAQLARAGDRSVSREIARAVREHLARAEHLEREEPQQ